MKVNNINIDEYLGKKFGMLTIIKFLHFKEYKNSRQPVYKCLCECGNTTESGLWNLKRPNISSCGCFLSKSRSFENGVASFNALFSAYRDSARKRGHSFSISKEYFKNIVDSDCEYCGSNPSNIHTTKNNTGDYVYNGIDRVDNSIGYKEGNCVACCIICNRAKSTLSLEDFKNWISKLVKKNLY